MLLGYLQAMLQMDYVWCHGRRHHQAMLDFGFHIIHVLVIDIDPDPKAKQAMNEIKLTNPEWQMDSSIADVVMMRVLTMTLNALLEAKQDIAREMKKRLTKAMLNFGSQIIQVLVIDVDPDLRVKQAMNEIKLTNPEGRMDSFIADVIMMHVFMMTLGALLETKQDIVRELKERLTNEVQELLPITQYLNTLEKISQGRTMLDLCFHITQVLVIDIDPNLKAR